MNTELPDDDAMLDFKGQKYRLSAIRSLIHRAPVIELKPEELNPIHRDPASVFSARVSSGSHDALHGEIVCYRQEGRYTVLLGQQTALRAISDGVLPIRACLISGPALKKALSQEVFRIDVDQPRQDLAGASRHERPREARPAGHRRSSPCSSDTITRRGFRKS